MTVSAIGLNAGFRLAAVAMLVLPMEAGISCSRASFAHCAHFRPSLGLPFRLPALQDRPADEAAPDDGLKGADRGVPSSGWSALRILWRILDGRPLSPARQRAASTCIGGPII